jgi:uncharacterized protein YbjT (DUF2867 family)
MELKIAAVLGASGLIGKEIVSELIENQNYSEIRIITRRPLKWNHPKIKEFCIDFEKLNEYSHSFERCSDVFCAVGTTTKKVHGDKIQYRKVDYDIPVDVAQMGFDMGIDYFAVVSSIGADEKSSNFYLQLKGEMEKEVSQFAIPQIAIFRPSMLMGKRSEFRFGEKIALFLFSLISFLFPTKYKPIQAKTVAKGMVLAAGKAMNGVQVLQYNEIQDLVSHE